VICAVADLPGAEADDAHDAFRWVTAPKDGFTTLGLALCDCILAGQLMTVMMGDGVEDVRGTERHPALSDESQRYFLFYGHPRTTTHYEQLGGGHDAASQCSDHRDISNLYSIGTEYSTVNHPERTAALSREHVALPSNCTNQDG